MSKDYHRKLMHKDNQQSRIVAAFSIPDDLGNASQLPRKD